MAGVFPSSVIKWCSGTNSHATSMKLLVFCFYLLILGVSIGNCSSVTNEAATIETNEPTVVTGATYATQQTTHYAPTIGPPPPGTIGPPPAGDLCGTQKSNSYDLTTLVTPPYWTLNKLGKCFDTFGNQSIGCEFSFAFCKYLPPDVASQKPGVGASQISTQPGSQRALLGGRSAVVQNTDGTQLLISFENGELKECGTLQVEFYLQCKQDAVWAIPISGSPGMLPSDTTVTLDQTNCKYIINADYNGACSTPSGLSAGTVLIILFLCTVATYLIGGIACNKFSGATGVELIPNYEVWKNFPSDVMGGFGFVVGLITCQKNTKSEEYDSI
ncbi:uncharacterized protein LOC117296081 [Asterias rubens]|uniref:uncharacterized protein LOC117296081 n=1 Tax=Asterias rubens TaxID=7604 RepID=UPI001455B179|nr:uncharacterized protein LOC117296081 [Asterias rubens]